MSSHALVQNCSRALGQPLPVVICDTFRSRFRGLMFRTDLGRDEGILLVGQRDARLDAAIHMLFVYFDLAVFWIDGGMKVVDRVLAKAWRPAYIPARPARYVLELHPDHASAFEIGHEVRFIDA